MPLPPKVFAVLHYLVTHPDRLVTKDELLDAVWPETAVSDAVVRVAIGALRKVLGDTAQTPRYIATVPRRGYRFLAPVAEDTGVVPATSPAGATCAFHDPQAELPGTLGYASPYPVASSQWPAAAGGGTPPPHRVVL